VAAARPTAPLNYPAGVSVREEQATSARRDASVRVRLYIPNELAEGASALLYLPGGGFVIPPSPASYVWCANFADEIGALVVLVEYRLAPENPFPAGFVDALTALEWLTAESGRLGIAGDRIAIGGDSAGAALAAGLALWCRDHGGPRLCLQYLGIPVLDDRLQTRSMTEFGDTPLWNRPAAELSWRYYLNGSTPLIEGLDATPYAAPARIPDLSGLPPTYISVCEFDPLRDEGLEYAMRLLHAGVTTELHAYPGTFHGSQQLPAAISRRMERDRVEALKARLGRGLYLAEGDAKAGIVISG
jgi:acetyl esterase/lipase